jgi:hypothetical protein
VNVENFSKYARKDDGIPDTRVDSQELDEKTFGELKNMQMKYFFKNYHSAIFEKLRNLDGITRETYLVSISSKMKNIYFDRICSNPKLFSKI